MAGLHILQIPFVKIQQLRSISQLQSAPHRYPSARGAAGKQAGYVGPDAGQARHKLCTMRASWVIPRALDEHWSMLLAGLHILQMPFVKIHQLCSNLQFH